MNRLLVQVFRNGAWCKVTTIAYEPGHNAFDAERKFAKAHREAMRQVGRWRAYFSDPLRIVEATSKGGYREVRT